MGNRQFARTFFTIMILEKWSILKKQVPSFLLLVEVDHNAETYVNETDGI
jgi:hypothetical protein